jgi:hypothetical protein
MANTPSALKWLRTGQAHLRGELDRLVQTRAELENQLAGLQNGLVATVIKLHAQRPQPLTSGSLSDLDGMMDIGLFIKFPPLQLTKGYKSNLH